VCDQQLCERMRGAMVVGSLIIAGEEGGIVYSVC
jgi:hypothetical protein